MAADQRELEIETADENENQDRPSFLSVIVTAIVIVVIVLVLLLLRGCDSAEAARRDEIGRGRIISVEGSSPEKGAVSVWLGEGTSANAIIGGAGVKATDVLSMGGDRYVIAVPEGTEEDAVARLVKTDGVVDAGFVYASVETE